MVQCDRTYQPINAYGMIGNCHSAVLVAPDGSVDWGCLPDFDSPALFCRLLDSERGGYFQIAPVDTTIPGVHHYLSGSNVLQTRFSSLAGEVVLTDFMPVETLSAKSHQEMRDARADAPCHCLVRHLTCTHGQLTVRMQFKVTPHYAAASSNVILITPSTRSTPPTGVIASGGQQHVGLFISGSEQIPSFSMHIEKHEEGVHPVVSAQFTLRKGEQLSFALGAAQSAQAALRLVEEELPARDFVAELAHTLECWRGWLARCTYRGPHLEAIHRSALTLKMMTYAPTGAIVAAPTTSLPEALGEGRNWDYRYTWLRDASFTLSALNRLGFKEETRAFIHWLCTYAYTGGRDPQIMYGLRGERHLPEYELGHLSGYDESRPVRIGNGAARQKQLDIFGEVLDCISLAQQLEEDSASENLTAPVWEMLCRLVEQACDHWHETDSGIWEVRGRPRHFVYSRAMCWVALDRGIRMAEHFELKANLPRWRRIRDQIRLDILTYGYNTHIKAFTQSYGSTALDASCLFLPLVGFIPADDPRMRSTVERIMEQLTDEHTFVYRYHADDGLTGAEGTFVMCTFWLVDNLALQGRLAEAWTIFERALECAGPLGLFSEEVDSANRRALGNYPQAFSHLALIHSALNLQKAEERLRRQQSTLPLVAAMMLEAPGQSGDQPLFPGHGPSTSLSWSDAMIGMQAD